MSSWTKEPWLPRSWTHEVNSVEMQRVDYDRALVCVNALAGIPDPERAIAAARVALSESLGTITGLAEQQAMPDEWYKVSLKKILAALALLEQKEQA